MFDTRKIVNHAWQVAIYAAIVAAIVVGFVAQMAKGECPV